MSIISYISEKKAKFQGRIEAQRSQKLEAKKVKIENMRKQNKKLAEEVKVEKEYQAIRTQGKDLSRKKFRGTIGGRIAENIKNKVKQAKNEAKARNSAQASNPGNPFSSNSSLGTNPFSKGGGSSPFGSSEKITKPKIKSKTIIKY